MLSKVENVDLGQPGEGLIKAVVVYELRSTLARREKGSEKREPKRSVKGRERGLRDGGGGEEQED